MLHMRRPVLQRACDGFARPPVAQFMKMASGYLGLRDGIRIFVHHPFQQCKGLQWSELESYAHNRTETLPLRSPSL